MEGSESEPNAPSSEVPQNHSPPRNSTSPRDNEEDTHLRFLLSKAEAGSIIGIGGSNINDIESESGARARVSRNYECFPGTTDRIIMVSGAVDCILKGVDLILSKLLDESNVEYEGEDDLVSKIKLVVPHGCCGGIIGMGGAIIRSMKDESGANIKISSQETDLHDRLVTVIGTLVEQRAAIELILLKLVQDKHYQLYGSVLYPVPWNNRMNYGPNGAGVQYQNNRPPNKQEDRSISCTFGVANEHVGLVIGRGGRAKLEISQISGARIKISERGDFIPGTSKRKVTITGSQEAIDTAVSLILERVPSGVERLE